MLHDTGTLNWHQVMQAASSDAVRLAILDETAIIKVGLRQYMDDQACKITSRAQTRLTRDTIRKATIKRGETLR